MIKYIQAVQTRPTQGLMRQIYGQIRRDFGMLVEPFTLHSPAPELLAGIWAACRETLLVGQVRREIKEAVATSVSLINRCPYCVDAHSMMLEGTENHEVAVLLSQGALDQISDPSLRAAVEWAAATRSPDSPLLQTPPFSSRDMAEIAGTAVVFHYINRMVSVLLQDDALRFVPQRFYGIQKRLVGWYFQRSIRRSKAAGLSLPFVPPASGLSPAFAWAADSPVIADAFARWENVVEASGRQVLGQETRARVQTRLAQWDGSDAPLGAKWLHEALSGLEAGQIPAARLALLTAFAPYRVDAKVIGDFRKQHPADDELIAALAWSSFAAARQISSWLHLPVLATG